MENPTKPNKLILKSIISRIKRNINKDSKFIKSLSINLSDKNVLLNNLRLKELHNKYLDHRCFIMGNGPSLNKMNLSLFENEIVWGSNRCYLLFDRISWRPRFYTAVDTRVVPDNSYEINDLINQLNQTKFFFPIKYRYSNDIISRKNVYWYDEKPLNHSNLPFTAFSCDASKYLYTVHTVAVAALQIAVYLGFNPIYLFGCDTSYSIPKSIEYEDNNPDFLISTHDDPNHFSVNYFGKGKKWHDPHVNRMIFHYEQSKKVCDSLGVRVYNATVGGKLEVFPRVNYLDIVSQI